MRPIRLRMSAFGPFANVEEIDFTRLGEIPLFLINGPTGAGKSTILDAICFALYGETTGIEREAKQMRSDHADPETLTEVSLEFQLASGRYRINRVPDQVRPKTRGEGVTEQKARAELYKFDDGKEILIVAPKVTEATSEIINLTGLSAEQFRQVMVLPQGKFRDLLLAKSDEREMIFQQLFQTHVYSTLQTRLRDQANSLTNQLKEVQLQQNALLGAQDLENSEQLQLELEALKTSLTNQLQQKQHAEARLKQLQSELQQAQQLEKTFQELAKAQAKLTELQVIAPQIEQQKIQLNLARQAREIEPLFAEMQKNQVALSKAQQRVRDTQYALSKAEQDLLILESAKQSLPDKEKDLEKVNAAIVELEKYRQRNQQLQAALTILTRAESAASVSQKNLIDKQSQLTNVKQTLDQDYTKFQLQSNVVAGLSEKKSQLEKLTVQGKSLKKIVDLQSSLTKLELDIANLKKVQEQANKHYQQKARDKEIYEQVWYKGQAAILAATLIENEACPVCGSSDHPAAAFSNEKLPSEQELNTIRQDTELARNALEKISRDTFQKEEEFKNLQYSLQQEKTENITYAELSLDAIRGQYQQCNKEIIELQKTADALTQLQLKIAENKNHVSALENSLSEAQHSANEKYSALAAANADVQNKKAELPEQYRQAIVLEDEIIKNDKERDRLKQTIDTINRQYLQGREVKVSAETALKSAEANQQTLAIDYGVAVAAWENSLQQSAFENHQAFMAARLEQGAEKNLTDIIRQFEDRKLLAQKQLDEKTASITDKARPDIQQLIDKEKQASMDKNTIESEYHKIQQRQELLSKSSDKLKHLQQQQNKLEKEYSIIGKLSDISNGKNKYNLSLQRFVLSVLLDDVLTEASYRLHKMSKGRYQLYRKDNVGDKRLKSGLELEVEDTYSGKQRPAATLSGGESFMAALALALGLSDVVQAYAGGIRLDTLFIDEGFGSLDPESLELAINTLLELRASGRMVGIISHVEELKRIIDVRLDVIADRGVSYTRLVGV